VEEITARTGNYKKFAVFARMLLAALRRDCDAVSADLLAFADLEALRARRAAPQGPEPSAGARGAPAGPAADAAAAGGGGEAGGGGGDGPGVAPGANNKRYLIMTYAVEYDRVHYPLPLAFQERPDPERLRATVAGLRAELDAARLARPPNVGMDAALVSAVTRRGQRTEPRLPAHGGGRAACAPRQDQATGATDAYFTGVIAVRRGPR